MIRWDGMGYDRIGWEGTKWDGRGGDEMKWDGTIRFIKVIACKARRSNMT